VGDLRVKLGDNVRAGQVIAVLNSRDQLEAALHQAESGVKVAETRIAQVRAGAKAADLSAQEAEISRLETELTAAETEYRRVKGLHDAGIASQSALETAALPVATTTKLIAQAKERLRSLNEVRSVDVAVAESQLESALADVNRTRAEYEAAIIRAPYDGQVIKVNAWRGEEVQAKGIVEIARIQKMYVIAEVAETDIRRLKVGQKADIKGNSLPQELHGTVEEIGRTIGKGTPNPDPVTFTDTRVNETKIRLDDADVASKLIHARVEVIIHP
jgi:HlyD family secretion protein